MVYEVDSDKATFVNHTNFTRRLGEVLSEMITAKGWTQQDVADILGCSRQALNEVLVTGRMSFKRFVSICRALDLEFTLTIRQR